MNASFCLSGNVTQERREVIELAMLARVRASGFDGPITHSWRRSGQMAVLTTSWESGDGQGG